MNDKERIRFRKHLNTLKDIPSWDDYMKFILVPHRLNAPTAAFEYAIGVFEEFCHYLDNKFGKEKRMELLKDFYGKNK